MHPSQEHELRILALTNVTQPPEDDRAVGFTVDCAYETRLLTDRHKFTIDIISGHCSAPWSGHHHQPLKTGCYLFLDKINHRWVSALSWSSIISLCSSTTVHGNTDWIVKHKGSFEQLFRGCIWKTELCNSYWDEPRPEIEKHLALYKEYLGANRD